MAYESKSILVARRKASPKSQMPYDVDIKLFAVNDPHKTANVPEKTLEFSDIEKVRIEGYKVSYWILGNDLVINDAGRFDVARAKGEVILKKIP